MWAVSDAYREAIARPHQMIFRATVAKGGVPLYGGRALPVTGGSVTVSSRQHVRRTCDLTIAPRLPGALFRDEPAFPATRTGVEPIGTDGQEITVRAGLVYAGGRVEWVPLGVFRIDEVVGSLLDRSGVRASGVSREAWVIDDRLHVPRTVSGPSAVAIIRSLILESFAAAEVAVSTRADRRVAPTVIERDRWADGVAALAESIGCAVYADPTGRFVIADAPTLDTAPVFRFQAGPGGVLLDAAGQQSRGPVSNAWVVTGTTPEGWNAPVGAEVRDVNPRSPTRYGDPSTGAWGRKPRFVSIPSLTWRGQCETVARAGLARTTGAGSSLNISSVPLYPLEAGDVVDVVTDHTRVAQSISRHIVDEITLPLVAGGDFRVSTRDLGEVTE
ncbi:DUF5047 domain-containing protein [Cellulosimicrobium cellulans]|uniref:DUF5047 domain-containing protein n=1 Tax=Cellulosimicrobium cellulans TaxID=1710 RepID=UPI001962A771|nr:DUF5047 domain-containing protein [Cellulosimicrobium cellulans]MBN0039392.1 DUF5047 domain-containing protein [Cellulosimicrobium cellulans]